VRAALERTFVGGEEVVMAVETVPWGSARVQLVADMGGDEQVQLWLRWTHKEGGIRELYLLAVPLRELQEMVAFLEVPLDPANRAVEREFEAGDPPCD